MSVILAVLPSFRRTFSIMMMRFHKNYDDVHEHYVDVDDSDVDDENSDNCLTSCRIDAITT